MRGKKHARAAQTSGVQSTLHSILLYLALLRVLLDFWLLCVLCVVLALAVHVAVGAAALPSGCCVAAGCQILTCSTGGAPDGGAPAPSTIYTYTNMNTNNKKMDFCFIIMKRA